MYRNLINIFKIKELKKKIIITFLLLIIYRVGCYIPLPGVNVNALAEFFSKIEKAQGRTLLGIMDLFTGGALMRSTIFSLGIMPYISSSIIMQLLTAVIPYLERLAKEGRSGYEIINQYTRYLTVLLCVVQGFFLALWLSNEKNFGMSITTYKGFGFIFTAILTLTAGTIFIMWLGEQIQERGIGNGISLIIAAGIISRIPAAISHIFLFLNQKQISIFNLIILLAFWVIVLLGVILFTQAQRKIPVQYGRRVIGSKIYAGQSTYLPIKVDMSGVIAIIFAQSVILFPATIATFFPKKIGIVRFLSNLLAERGLGYNIIYIVLILFFMYFYTAMVFNPTELANALKKNGGVIPGIQSGKLTAQYIDYITTRIVFIGAVYVSAIALLPNFILHFFKVITYDVASLFGGTTLLILVGVILDTARQIEGKLLTYHYDGFIKGGSLKGRR